MTSQAYPTDPTMPTAAPAGYVTPTIPANPGKFEPPMTAAQVDARRGQFYELLLKQVVQALTGFFLPGVKASDQLSGFGATIPGIGPLVQFVTGLVGAPLSALGTFFGNLTGVGGFLPGNFNSGSFDPISFAVDFISSIMNPSNLLGGLFSAGLIPTMDGSKIVSGAIAPSITGVADLRDYMVSGMSGATGISGAENDDVRQYIADVSTAAAAAGVNAADLQSQIAAQFGNANSNTGVGGMFLTIGAGPSGAPGAPLT